MNKNKTNIWSGLDREDGTKLLTLETDVSADLVVPVSIYIYIYVWRERDVCVYIYV